MKVTNWKRKLAASLVAAGVWLGGSSAHAQVIDHFIGDASFDDTAVPAADGYAYFNGPPDSAWESTGNWWYNTAYAAAFRPAPRTGDQALHGGADYNFQVLGDTFEAGRTYTLSAYVSGDMDATGPSNGTDRAWLYIYDGSTNRPASFDNDSLVSAFYDRDGVVDVFNGIGSGTNEGWSVADGTTDVWGRATLTYTATAADDGLPIGVGLYSRGDGAIDDVSLQSTVPQFSIEVNRSTGIVSMVNPSSSPVELDYYEIQSAGGSLSVTGWNSFDDQNLDAIGGGDGQSWDEIGGLSNSLIGEAFLLGSTTLDPGGDRETLGQAYNTTVDAQDLQFFFAAPDNALMQGMVEYVVGGPNCDLNGDNNCDVDDIDVLYDDIAAGTVGGPSDIDGSGIVDNDDIDDWLAAAGAQNSKEYLPGDTNLDGNVGGPDFTTLALNFGNSGADPAAAESYWRHGNFDGNGTNGLFEVGGPDFTGLALNFGHVSVNSVPEPQPTLWCSLLLGCGLWQFLRRRN